MLSSLCILQDLVSGRRCCTSPSPAPPPSITGLPSLARSVEHCGTSSPMGCPWCAHKQALEHSGTPVGILGSAWPFEGQALFKLDGMSASVRSPSYICRESSLNSDSPCLHRRLSEAAKHIGEAFRHHTYPCSEQIITLCCHKLGRLLSQQDNMRVHQQGELAWPC